MLSNQEKKLIEENMHTVEIVVKLMMAKYNIPQNEYEDYCQIGYVVLCSKAHKYDGSTKFSTFANKVLTNAFIDKYRSERTKIKEMLSLDHICKEDKDGSGASLSEFLAADIDVENEVLSNVTSDLLKSCIKTAKNKCSANTTVKGFEALELKLEGYSGKEIADLFDVPPNSLRSWMSRAKKLLLSERDFAMLVCE